MRLRVLLLLVGASLLSRTGVCQNLVQNPGFATDLASWTEYATSPPDPVGVGTGVWSPQDALGSPTSGSANVNFAATPTGANAGYGIRQCISLASLQPVSTAIFGARFKLPTAQVADGGANVTVDVAFFSAAGCSGQLITGGSQGKNVLPPDLSDTVWNSTDIQLPGFTIAPLPSPLSAELRLFARRVGTNPNTLNVFLDMAYFAVNGSTPVELLGYEVK